jgi:hypothetical protein
LLATDGGWWLAAINASMWQQDRLIEGLRARGGVRAAPLISSGFFVRICLLRARVR